MKKSGIFYFFCLFFVLVKSDVNLTENAVTKIKVPTDELILHVEDNNIESSDVEGLTIFCFAAKDVTTKDDFCGENQCSIRIKYYLLDGEKNVYVQYSNKRDSTSSTDSVDIKVDKTTIKGITNLQTAQCSWDDHGEKYLLVKVTNVSDRVVFLKNAELSNDTSTNGNSKITFTLSTVQWYIFGIIIGITVLFDM
uniref:Transmembrane protein n=1 Tax=Panagrolaimus sp. JU765 TaxID=591449 RepID=A0AC34PZU6_9BILA